MSESELNPQNTYAVIVGIEKYENKEDALKGPTSNALEFAKWLSDCKVPKENIFLFISEADKNKNSENSENYKEATRSNIYHTIFQTIQNIKQDQDQEQNCLLYIFWAGHGYMSNNERRLLYGYHNPEETLNLNSLLDSLKTNVFKVFSKQILFIDACAIHNPYEYPRQESKEEYLKTEENNDCEQLVLLATQAGDTARFNKNSGLFSEVLLTELRNKNKLLLPEEMKEIAEKNIRKVFDEGKYKDKQLPIFKYYRKKGGDEENGGLTKSTQTSILLEERWKKLELILSEIDDLSTLYASCYFVLSEFTQDVNGNYPKLNLLKSKADDKKEISNILKEIFLVKLINNNKKRNSMFILDDFVNYLLILNNQEKIRKKLIEWKRKTDEELQAMDINPQKNKQAKTWQKKYKDFHPYLVITCEPKSYEKFYLSAELILHKDNNSLNFPITDNNEIEGFSIKNLQDKFDYLLLFSYKIIHLCGFTNENLIVEIFLPRQQLTKPSDESYEKIEIKIDNFSNDRKWVGCHHKFVLRSFERLQNFDYTPLSIIKEKWDQFNTLISKEQEINKKIKWIYPKNDNFESQSDIFGINLLCFSEVTINDSIKQVIQEGLPLFIWIRGICVEQDKLKEEFEKLLTVNIDNLLENIKNKRLNGQTKDSLGYHLGFLCDNPYRLPSRYDTIGSNIVIDLESPLTFNQ